MKPKWFWFPLYVWALPPVIVGVVLALWGGWQRSTWTQGVWVVSVKKIAGGEWVAGQTWSWLVLVRDTGEAPRKTLLVHEFVHVLHCLFLGVFFYLSYGIHFLWHRMKGVPYQDAYRAIWTERIAYRQQDEFDNGKRPDAWGGA